MIEVFITSISNRIQAESVLKSLTGQFPRLKFNFDLDNSEAPFPCGHSILRAEGAMIDTESIISVLNKSGYKCEILEDKVCI
ncbi:hypothetical protein [Emticicia fontis]